MKLQEELKASREESKKFEKLYKKALSAMRDADGRMLLEWIATQLREAHDLDPNGCAVACAAMNHPESLQPLYKNIMFHMVSSTVNCPSEAANLLRNAFKTEKDLNQFSLLPEYKILNENLHAPDLNPIFPPLGRAVRLPDIRLSRALGRLAKNTYQIDVLLVKGSGKALQETALV
ncbi:hypothetical protein HK097_011321 [Rhizophlyctis rosea]|uniref:Uncharacterized protein n=1 Tax=Rhizophlyctis rosea TaxID=64517 RepID=A0AAD5SIB0_9FUNG|nr:hypothetical protein HK097_011321 [Rhizophlyctis rosea]